MNSSILRLRNFGIDDQRKETLSISIKTTYKKFSKLKIEAWKLKDTNI